MPDGSPKKHHFPQKVTLLANGGEGEGTLGVLRHNNNDLFSRQDTPQTMIPSQRKGHVRVNSKDYRSEQLDSRLVVVRYFLDRPGYGLHNSAARLWFHPPKLATPTDIQDYLKKQGIALEGLLVEIYLDKFESFMMLDACEHSLIEWDFSETCPRQPGILAVRLTDLDEARQEEGLSEMDARFPSTKASTSAGPQHANTTPVGLFSFSMMVGLETVGLMSTMFPDLVDPAWVVTWGPYMFFVGGLMQVITGTLQVFRNNIYGAVAFITFGCFWFSNGTVAILKTHFTDDGSRADDLLQDTDPGGHFFRNLYILMFCCVLLKQTFVMNRLSTTLITLLCLKVAAGSLTGYFEEAEWVQLVFGTATALFAFWVFTVEFTNQIYNREVFPVFKWSDSDSPEETFGAAGRQGTLHSKAARLRQASYPTVRAVRGAAKRQSTDDLSAIFDVDDEESTDETGIFAEKS